MNSESLGAQPWTGASSEELRLMRLLEELRDRLAKWNQSSGETKEASVRQDGLRDTTSRSQP